MPKASTKGKGRATELPTPRERPRKKPEKNEKKNPVPVYKYHEGQKRKYTTKIPICITKIGHLVAIYEGDYGVSLGTWVTVEELEPHYRYRGTTFCSKINYQLTNLGPVVVDGSEYQVSVSERHIDKR